MTRRLVFDGDKAARRFELLRFALEGAGDGKGERTRQVIRQEARLFDLFDTISELTDKPDDGWTRRLLCPPQSITVAQADHELLVRYTDTALWFPRSARDAVDLQDWLSAADKLDE